MSKNRFENPERKKRIIPINGLTIAMFAVIIAVFFLGVSFLTNSSVRDEKGILEKAINRDIVHCYAVEGFYPPSISYIEEHFGLTYDHEKYLVDYETIGNNIMPNIMIIERN